MENFWTGGLYCFLVTDMKEWSGCFKIGRFLSYILPTMAFCSTYALYQSTTSLKVMTGGWYTIVSPHPGIWTSSTNNAQLHLICIWTSSCNNAQCTSSISQREGSGLCCHLVIKAKKSKSCLLISGSRKQDGSYKVKTQGKIWLWIRNARERSVALIAMPCYLIILSKRLSVKSKSCVLISGSGK